MDPQQPYQGFSPAAYGTPASYAPPVSSASPQPPMLRPLSTGEVLDRTMALYRRYFWLFAGIGSMPAILTTLSSTLNLIVMGNVQSSLLPGARAGATPVVTPQDFSHILARQQFYVLPLSLLFLVAYGISKAATAKAVAEISSGRAITVADAYRAVLGRWLRWSGIVLRQYLALGWPIGVGVLAMIGVSAGAEAMFRSNPALVGIAVLCAAILVVAGFVFGVLNYLRVALAEAAGVVEDLGVNASLARSRALVAGRKGRIFLALLLVYVLYMVAGGAQLPFLMLAQLSRGASHVLQLIGVLVVGFVAMSLVLPVASIALTLFYIDERVRREGYDIELLLQRSAATSTPEL